MKKNDVNVKAKFNEDGDIELKITEKEQERIPMVGKKICVLKPYPIAELDTEFDEETGDKVTEDDLKQKPVEGWSYAKVPVKSVVLSDEGDEVTVNGDYKIPLNDNAPSSKKKLIVLSNEDEAKDKWRTLMNSALKEANRRFKLAGTVRGFIQDALEEQHH